MYTISQYGNMYMREARLNAYASALRIAVRPNSVVLDIGAGTGIFALLACRFGARRVYAIEPDDAINVARELAAANGFADRLVCIQNLSTKVALPESADIIVSDLSGSLPLLGQHIPAIIDARTRLLKPGGELIPQQDRLRGAIIEASDQYRKLSQPWTERPFDLNLAAGWPLVANTLYHLAAKDATRLAGPSNLVAIDYRTIERANIAVRAEWVVQQSGTGHGMAIWFDRIVADGIEISNDPAASDAICTADVYGQLFFPWATAVGVRADDRIIADLRADLVGDDYVWQWDTTIHGREKQEGVKAHFRQSTLFGYPLSVESLQRREVSYIPTLDEDGRIDRMILTHIDGHASIREIAGGIAESFSARYKTWQDALSRVVTVIGQSRGR